MFLPLSRSELSPWGQQHPFLRALVSFLGIGCMRSGTHPSHSEWGGGGDRIVSRDVCLKPKGQGQ